ncbi:ankyrin repeat and LEM domain-containing protein 2 homolog isoform X2 [Solenopsis invicta]|uniref:ankyrin repeat and LEM domain-containing protein 2 homolog isoform X2 n=1 Tax=Solenopsis invicta TaxID=13686 RepID=UPI000595AD96|nr:ankyrin repeat and LEM domain-containing protein 2 homolog isoform X2 [Solenopsis invicta]
MLNENIEKTAMSEGENVLCNTHPNLPVETLYHAVYLPLEYMEENADGKGILHIYLEMQDALKVINTYKKGRLKSFKNYSDAVAYAKTGYKESTNNYSMTVATVKEQSSNFEAPSPQDLTAFKRLIQDGDLETVKNIVWENPRYLISSGDTPAILQMGSRYNALHIAAKEGHPEMCELILNTVGDPKFMLWHYGEDKCKTYVNPTQIMQDLYLNTPDKGLNETPLHFAVKHGFKDVVRVLVSYSQCIKTLPNKHQQLPKDIICARRCQENKALKREILMLLEDQFYVPVLRTEGNACPPIIGEPFSPTSPLNLNNDPISPRVEVRAFAGPMSKTQAVEFRKKWKTPPRVTPKKGQGDSHGINSPNVALRLQDTEKGLERVGRDLAKECEVPWKEYWPFLKDFVDFRNDDGLTKLEKYFEQKFKDYKEQLFYSTRNLNNNAYASTSCEVESVSCQQTPKEMDAINDIQYLCDKLCLHSLSSELDNIEEDTDSLEFFTPPSSPELIQDNIDDMQTAEEGSQIFLEGFSPTKLDYAVYNALSSAICPDAYPCIYRWRHDMQLAMKRDPCRFDKTSLRRKLFTVN